MHTSIKLVKRVAHTVLCKRNANEIRCFSFFVLAKTRRNFARKFRPSARELSLSQTKFRCHLGEISFRRNFVRAKIRTREISPGRKFALTKFPQSKISLAMGAGCNENPLFGSLGVLGGLGSFGSLAIKIISRFQLFWSQYPKPLARITNKLN